MFIRKSVFENLVKRCENQQQQIEKLSEMVGMFAQAESFTPQFDVDFEKDWKLSNSGRDESACRQDPLLPDWSF